MKCPKCGAALNKVKIKTRPEYGGDVLKDAEETREIEVDQCLSCNGIWFDQNELQQYLSEKLIILDSPPIEKYETYNKKAGLCPRCQTEMAKKPSPKDKSIIMDICEKCNGVWLDGSELDKLEGKNLTFIEKNKLVFRNLKALFGRKEG